MTELIVVRGTTFLVDDEDRDLFPDGHFHIVRNARSSQKKPYLYWHNSASGPTLSVSRLILGLPKGNPLQADHINGDTTDNRRSNLRIVTIKQNAENRHVAMGETGVRGVSISRFTRPIKKTLADGTTKTYRYNIVQIMAGIGDGRELGTMQRQRRAHLATPEWIQQTIQELADEAERMRSEHFTHSDGR